MTSARQAQRRMSSPIGAVVWPDDYQSHTEGEKYGGGDAAQQIHHNISSFRIHRSPAGQPLSPPTVMPWVSFFCTRI